jgi:hypothetical protein
LEATAESLRFRQKVSPTEEQSAATEALAYRRKQKSPNVGDEVIPPPKAAPGPSGFAVEQASAVIFVPAPVVRNAISFIAPGSMAALVAEFNHEAPLSVFHFDQNATGAFILDGDVPVGFPSFTILFFTIIDGGNALLVRVDRPTNRMRVFGKHNVAWMTSEGLRLPLVFR